MQACEDFAIPSAANRKLDSSFGERETEAINERRHDAMEILNEDSDKTPMTVLLKSQKWRKAFQIRPNGFPWCTNYSARNSSNNLQRSPNQEGSPQGDGDEACSYQQVHPERQRPGEIPIV
jgi:hypothetical protein